MSQGLGAPAGTEQAHRAGDPGDRDLASHVGRGGENSLNHSSQ